MGLITEDVLINLNQMNISRYVELGYIIRKNEKTKMVKAKDLPKSSRCFVEVKCDLCGSILKRRFYDYYRHSHDGKYYCQKCACKKFNSGENNPHYNHNKTQEEREKGRNYPEYYEFVKRVLARDNYTCKCCGKHNNKMEVHHLYSYSTYKEYRTNDKFAVTLCKNCHSNFHLNYGKNDGDNTPKQFYEWIGTSKLDLEKYNGVLQISKKVICLETKKIWNSASECAKEINSSESSVRHVCTRQNGNNTLKRKHFMYLEEYEKISKEEIDIFLMNNLFSSSKMVVCITTGKVFYSQIEATNYYFGCKKDITPCLKGKYKYSGKINGKPLKWMYYNEYSKLINDEYMGNYTY